MPTIKARPVDLTTEVRLLAKLTKRNHDVLVDYTAMIGEGENVSYVLEQLIDTVLAKDKDFLEWRRTKAGERTPVGAGLSRKKPARTLAAGDSVAHGPLAVPA